MIYRNVQMCLKEYVSLVLSGCLLISAFLLNGEGLPLSALQGIKQNKEAIAKPPLF